MSLLVSRRTWLWTLLIGSLAFNVGFGTTFGVRTYWHYCRGECGPAECSGRQGLLAALNLTPDQQQRMDAARARLVQQVDQLRQNLTPERDALVDLLSVAAPDRAAITAQLDKIAAVQRQIQGQVVEHLLEEKNLLTPDQQAAFNEIIRRRVCPPGGHGPESVPGASERAAAGDSERFGTASRNTRNLERKDEEP
jgi:Spy/CpxP family protein refolding chaperone